MVVGDTHMFPGFLTPVLTQLFFPKPPTTFPNASAEVRGENTPERKFGLGKEEIAYYEQFLLFPQCLLFNQIIVPHSSIFLTSYFYLLLNWKSPKLAFEGKG